MARVLRDPGYSEETTQEVYLRGATPATTIPAGSALAWLLTLAHRRAVDRVRAEQAAAQREFRTEAPPLIGPPTSLPTQQSFVKNAAKSRVLDTLTDAQRECIELAYYGAYMPKSPNGCQPTWRQSSHACATRCAG